MIYNVVPLYAVHQSDLVIHIYIPFLILSSIMVYPQRLYTVPVLYSRTSLLIHCKCNSFQLLTPDSLSILLLLPSSLANTSLLSLERHKTLKHPQWSFTDYNCGWQDGATWKGIKNFTVSFLELTLEMSWNEGLETTSTSSDYCYWSNRRV